MIEVLIKLRRTSFHISLNSTQTYGPLPPGPCVFHFRHKSVQEKAQRMIEVPQQEKF